ncbi:MAG TPA: LptF/LptG family permease [Planctomycetota bacterium]|nr:LptF/LptG family permease [Planctomycetota bacterium]
MWKLHRYYLKELVVNAGITFLVLFAVVLVSLIARGIQRSQGGGLLDAALIIVLWALDSFPHLLTIAFLIATVLTFTRASQDRELIAIRAAGLSPRVPMTAAVLVGIALSVIGSLALHYVIPDVHFRKYRVIAEVVRNAFVNLKLGSDRIKVLETGYVMTFRRHEDYEYFDCILFCPSDGPLRDLESPILHVDKIAILPIEEHAETLSIVLTGIRDPIGGNVSEGLPISLSLHDLINRERRDDSNDDMRSDQLLSEVLRGVHRAPHEAVYTLFRRCCFALMPALLAPIGYCIAEFARERGRMVALVLALIPLALFYLGEVLGARLLATTQSPWSAWLPAVLLLAGGLPLCWRQLRR